MRVRHWEDRGEDESSGKRPRSKLSSFYFCYFFTETKNNRNTLRALKQFSIKVRHCRPRALRMAFPQLVLPLALQSVSPALSAFHINRARRRIRSGGEEVEKEADLADTHCQRCRRFQLDGSADTRLVRDNKHRPSASVILQKTCRSCGFTRRTPLVKDGAALFPNRRKRNRQNRNLNPPGTKMEVEGKTQSAARTQSPPAAQTSQVREPTASTSDGPKKPKNRKARSGLQEMLERKRKQDQAKSTGTSLTSFLQEL